MTKIIEQGLDQHGAYFQVCFNGLTHQTFKRFGKLARNNSKNITWEDWYRFEG